MSRPTPDRLARRLRRNAPRFAALGHDIRVSLLLTLSDGTPRSITDLTEGSAVTRQAITKHLRVLQEAGLVSVTKRGREKMHQIDRRSIEGARDALDDISHQWDEALGRLKAHVEG